MIPANANPIGTSPFDTVGTATKLASGTQSKPVDSPEEQKLKKAAGDFESILLASMWKSMKQSFGSDDETESDPAHGTLDDWGIEIMSEAVGQAGGLGIGKMILKNLEPTINQQTSPDPSSSGIPTKGSANNP